MYLTLYKQCFRTACLSNHTGLVPICIEVTYNHFPRVPFKLVIYVKGVKWLIVVRKERTWHFHLQTIFLALRAVQFQLILRSYKTIYLSFIVVIVVIATTTITISTWVYTPNAYTVSSRISLFDCTRPKIIELNKFKACAKHKFYLCAKNLF